MVEMTEDKAREIFQRGKDMEDMLDHPGFKYVLEWIEKGLARDRFLGCRPGKLLWMQGFQACADGMLKFINAAIEAKEKIAKTT